MLTSLIILNFQLYSRANKLRLKKGCNSSISYLFLEIYPKSINQTSELSNMIYLIYFVLKMSFRVLNGLRLKQTPNLQGEKYSLYRVIFNYGFFSLSSDFSKSYFCLYCIIKPSQHDKHLLELYKGKCRAVSENICI